MIQNLFRSIFKGLGTGQLTLRWTEFLSKSQKREVTFFLPWLNAIFNGVDKNRLKLLGPDRTCAEWLLRNGAAVRFKGQPTMITDYNVLMGFEDWEGSGHYRIEEIYAEKADISQVGFEHLRDCNDIKKITFIFCNYLTDQAVFKLKYVQNSLQYLEIRAAFNVSDKGVTSLTELRNLRTLILENLPGTKNKTECETILKRELPNCNIQFLP